MRNVLKLAAILSLGLSAPVRSESNVDVVVNQKTDALALSAYEMFKFDPQVVRIAPGDSVTFLNSMADHTVHSIPQIWPEGVEEIHFDNKPQSRVVFDQQGVYGITCARHGQYGMVMLILVGKPEVKALEAAASQIPTTRLTPDAKTELQSLFNAVAQEE